MASERANIQVSVAEAMEVEVMSAINRAGGLITDVRREGEHSTRMGATVPRQNLASFQASFDQTMLSGYSFLSGCTDMKTPPNSGQQNPTQSVGSQTGLDADAFKSFESYREARARRAAMKVLGHAVAVGVYAIKAAEPCHLVELQLEGVGPGLDFGGFTQPAAGQPQAVWQVPWMEVVLNSTGTKVVGDSEAIDQHPEMLRPSNALC